MHSPPRGKNAINHRLASLALVAHERVAKKKAEMEPTIKAISKIRTVHRNKIDLSEKNCGDCWMPKLDKFAQR